MTTISLSPGLVTLINVFTVEPANQQQLLELLAGPINSDGRSSAMLQFPGGYIAEVHAQIKP